jgi:SAM-dependent methyltransferase
MRRVSHEVGVGGNVAAYWDDEWRELDAGTRVDAVLAAPNATLRALDAAVPRDALVLEAGCGPGVVAAFMAARGRRVVGVDFAMQTLLASHDAVKVPLAAGDLRRLPFHDGAFDALVSLGAIEHQLEGPVAVLAEHRRVVKRGGTMFITVPSISLQKQLNDTIGLRFGRRASYVSPRRRTVERVARFGEPTRPGMVFVQYEIPRAVLRGLIEDAGFRCDRSWLTQTNAGIGESGLVRRARALAGRVDQPSLGGARGTGGDGGIAATPAGGGRLKRAVLAEDAVGPFTLVRSAARHLFGHSLAVVATAI